MKQNVNQNYIIKNKDNGLVYNLLTKSWSKYLTFGCLGSLGKILKYSQSLDNISIKNYNSNISNELDYIDVVLT